MAASALRCRSAIIDGEMCAHNATGVTDFKALRSAIKGAPGRLDAVAHLISRTMRSARSAAEAAFDKILPRRSVDMLSNGLFDAIQAALGETDLSIVDEIGALQLPVFLRLQARPGAARVRLRRWRNRGRDGGDQGEIGLLGKSRLDGQDEDAEEQVDRPHVARSFGATERLP